MKEEKLAIRIIDNGDNYPVNYELRSDSDGFHLIDFADLTFGQTVTFSYRVLEDVISGLERLREFG